MESFITSAMSDLLPQFAALAIWPRLLWQKPLIYLVCGTMIVFITLSQVVWETLDLAIIEVLKLRTGAFTTWNL